MSRKAVSDAEFKILPDIKKIRNEQKIQCFFVNMVFMVFTKNLNILFLCH